MTTLAIVGVVIAGFAILLVVVLAVVVFFMFRKMKRLERRLKVEIGRNSLNTRNSDVQNSRPVEMDGLDRNIYNPTPELTAPVQAPVPTYENTKPSRRDEMQANSLNMSGSLPNRTVGEPSANYTVVPDSLPAFLRNEEMLNVPVVSDDVVKTAQKEFDESYARLSMIRMEDDTPPINEGDYVDPQDARNKAASNKTHEKLEQRVSKGKRNSDNNVKLSNQKQKITMANREDYTEVSDALNDSTAVNISDSINTTSSMSYRSRTTSDTSPVKKASHDSVRKTHSMKRPEHCKNPATSQPLNRKSTAKEFVTFDPKGGFKLSAKRSSSDGVPRPAILNDSQRSSDSQPSTEETSTPVTQPDVGGKHMYAAVDLTAKCRPETDMIRREGVGTPDHYIACV